MNAKYATAVGVLLLLTGCDYFSEQTDKPTLAGPKPDLDALMDAELSVLRQDLPQKMADNLDMTDTRRIGKDVTYTYQFQDEVTHAGNFDVAAGKKVAIPELCNTASTRQYLDAGYRFVFTYRFKQGADVVVHVVAADCKTI